MTMSPNTATILLVDDEELLRAGVQEMLEIQGYNVITAANGQHALECLDAQPIDLIITDLVMPKMNGIDFVQQLRQVRPDVPVIVVSGSTRNIMQRYGIDTIQVPGADASLPKPFKGVDLVAQVRQLLESRL
ncbi:response regulator [Limnohabitans sp. yimb22184]|uniref:response regulator n=1 Tax=Limnohabitans sp. YIMB22184 TaxID=3374104 RepID=UPI003A88D87D